MHVGNHIWAKSYGSFEIISSCGSPCRPLKEGEGLGAEVRATDGSRKEHQGKEEYPQSPQGKAMEIKSMINQ